MKKQKIKITRGTIAHGVGDCRPGRVMTVDMNIARQLFVAGKAVPCEMKPEKPSTKTVKKKAANKPKKAKGKK